VGGGGRDGRIGRWSRTMLANKNRCGSRRIRRRTTEQGGFVLYFGPFGFYFLKLGPSYVWAGPAERTPFIAESDW
jgi:hypothetical protein